MGAIHAVVAHPTDPDVLYVGTVNGGVWRTTNASTTPPSWTPLTDDQASLSIGALEFDPTDSTAQTLVAGVGSFSSYLQLGGPLTGLLRTTDGGASWTERGESTLAGKNVSGVAPRGTTLVVSVNRTADLCAGSRGIYRSTDGGLTFEQVLAGVPAGTAHDLAGDAGNPSVLYASIASNVYFDGCSGGGPGIYKSTDTGATWTKVSDAAMVAVLTEQVQNVEIAVGSGDTVYVGIPRGPVEGRLTQVFRSPDGGTSWTAMDPVLTNFALDAPVPERLTQGIRFEQVSFRYPGTERAVPEDVDLDVKAGSVVVLVGENGAGKTTLVKLLCRLYAPTSGRITVDRVDLARLAADEWRARLSGAFQDFLRFEYVAQRAVGVGDLDRLDDRLAAEAAVERGGAHHGRGLYAELYEAQARAYR